MSCGGQRRTRRGWLWVGLLPLLACQAGQAMHDDQGVRATACEQRFSEQPLRIALIGDSITHGLPGHLTYRFPLWQMLFEQSVPFDFIGNLHTSWGGEGEVYPDPRFDSDHDGHWGATTVLYAERFTGGEVTWPIAPDIALIHLGTNDTVSLGTPPVSEETIELSVAAYAQIIAELRRRNSRVRIAAARILAAGKEPQRDLWTVVFNTRLLQMLEEQNRHESPILVVDQAIGLSRETHTYDSVHPNELGERELARRWFVAIRRILTDPALCPR